MNLVAALLIAAGFFFAFAGVVGVIRMPDFYTRLHAMGKNDTLGVSLMVFALVFHEGLSLNSLKILLIALFVAISSPTATHALGRAAHRAGLAPWTAGVAERPETSK